MDESPPAAGDPALAAAVLERLRPAPFWGYATATIRRRGGRTAVIDVEAAADRDVLVALGRAVFAVLPACG